MVAGNVTDGGWVWTECNKQAFPDSYSMLQHRDSCYVTYNDAALTWFEAARKCGYIDARLALLPTPAATTTVSFFTAALIPQKCSWVGLVKKVFQWTEVARKYALHCAATTKASKLQKMTNSLCFLVGKKAINLC